MFQVISYEVIFDLDDSRLNCRLAIAGVAVYFLSFGPLNISALVISTFPSNCTTLAAH